jgi:Ca2+-binding EF-hand superfamily protein
MVNVPALDLQQAKPLPKEEIWIRGPPTGRRDEIARFAGLIPEEVRCLENAFKKYDRDDSGEMDLAEATDLFAELALPIDPGTFQKYIQVVFEGSDRRVEFGITLPEFMSLYRAVAAAQPAAVRRKCLAKLVPPEGARNQRMTVTDVDTQADGFRETFFFHDRDGSGLLTVPDLMLVMQHLGVLDIEGDGFENFLLHTFKRMDLHPGARVGFTDFVYIVNAAIEQAASLKPGVGWQQNGAFTDRTTSPQRQTQDWSQPVPTPRRAKDYGPHSVGDRPHLKERSGKW